MISVVLYGRNDAHGYNLHKRAAISLNAIAELLSDADDEILFVDYNTPDDLPTFAEAIADTLSPKARARLKVLRVRAQTHRERYAARTHLAALEPIARNVAIRRSNPANRWVLSTNTDMIFCPRKDGQSLSAICAGLADGFYHLPRFELPEGLWETLDRTDGAGAIASARAWGERWNLNEIVFADRDNLYDAPGDFQLFLRQDLFDIGGFHEDMILGWHLDANIAKRMRLLRGKVSSALEHMIGYHCDHTRLGSPYHKADRLENDQVRFNDQVRSPQAAEQMDSWGLPDVDVEAFSLGEASAERYRRALEATIPAPLSGFLETQYVLEDYGRLDYPLEHVLPYLLDLVSCIPSDTRIGYLGARTDTFDAFARGWAAMGGTPVTVLEGAAWLKADGGRARAAPLAEWRDCDLFIFEIGAAAAVRHQDLTAEESRRLWQVDQGFKIVIDSDSARRAGHGHPTRVIVINGVHNFFEPQMMTEVAVTLTPYSSRIRHGYVADRAQDRIQGASADQLKAMRALRGLQPPTLQEMQGLVALAARLGKAAEGDPVWQQAGRAGAELEALIGAGLVDVGADMNGVSARLRAARPSSDPQVQDALDPAAGRGAPSRLVRVEDWDDPAFALAARRLFSNRDHAALAQRDVWGWERIALGQNLMAALPPAQGGKVLVIGGAPEALAFALAHQGYEVDIAAPDGLAAGVLKSTDWRGEFAKHGWATPRPVGLVEDRAEDIAAGLRYDAVLIGQNGLFFSFRAGVSDVLKTVSGLLRPGGHLGLATMTQPVAADDRLQEHALSHAFTEGASFGKALERWAGLAMDGSADMRVTPRTFDRSGASAEGGFPPLVLGAAPQVEVPGVWSLHLSGHEPDWDALRAMLVEGVYRSAPSDLAAVASSLFTLEDLVHAPAGDGLPRTGSLLDAAVVRDGVVKTPLGLRAPATAGAGVIASVVLGRLGAGHYDLEVEVDAGPLTGPGLLAAAAVVSDGRIIVEDGIQADAAGVYRIDASLDLGEASAKGLCLLIKVGGLADVSIPTLALR